MGNHTTIAELSLLKPLLPIRIRVIRIRVIRKGKIVVVSRFEKSELILGDEKGNTIQATFLRDMATTSSQMPLEEGHCYVIKSFILTPSSESVRLTKNRYHINLDNSSGISKIDPFSLATVFYFPKFDDIYRGLVHPKFSIDLYGAIVGVGFLEEYMTEPTHLNNGLINHKIRFFLQNTENVVIKCVADGVLAHVFQELWNSKDADIVLCMLQFWQINWGVGKLKNVTNIEGFSKIIFEPKDVPEIDAFRKRIANQEF